MDFIQVINGIDWLFASVLLIGGRYWGAKYFKAFKNPDYNFLLFSTIFGAIWLLIQKVTVTISKDQVGNLFLTYLFTTSFYAILAKKFFEWLEERFGKKQDG